VTNHEPSALHLTIGQSIEVVERSNGIPFHLDRLRDNSPVVLDQIISVVYDEPDHILHLPPSRFVMISQYAGVVTGIDTSPQLRYLDLGESHSLAVALKAQLEAAHWQLVRSYPGDLELLQRLISDPTRHGRFERDYAEFRIGEVHLRLYIKEAIGIGLEEREPAVRRNLFLVNVDLVDPNRVALEAGRVFAKRRELTGKPNESLPLSAFLGK